MTPQYQFNLGQGYPLLTSRVTSPEQFYDNISQEIERLNALKMKTLVAVKYGIISRTFDKGFHTKGEVVVRCDNGLPLSSF